jgi:hypothetical protein
MAHHKHHVRGNSTPTHGTCEEGKRPTPHRGHLITPSAHGHHISRDGHHIATLGSMDEAKRDIDTMTGH